MVIAEAIRKVVKSLQREYLLWALLAGLAVLSAIHPAPIQRYPALVDWPTIAALTGLLILTTGIEASGYLGELAHRLIKSIHSERGLAVSLTSTAALLASVLTNDIALFIIVPLTLSLGRHANLPVARLVIFEAIAVNVGSTLTPIGNPQNLFLWHVSGASFFQIVWLMTPLVALLMGVLLVFVLMSFSVTPIELASGAPATHVDKKLLGVSLALYLPFIVLMDVHWSGLGVIAVFTIFLIGFRRVLAKVDWVLLVVFILMFIDLRLLAELPSVLMLFGYFDLAQPHHLFLAGVGSSQVISNVPAAILLANYSNDWRMLLYAVNVGGFGLVLGSLANVIALRLARIPGIGWSFHLYSVPFLIVAGGLTYAWLFLL